MRAVLVVKGIPEIKSYMDNIRKTIPNASNKMTLALTRYASNRARTYASAFSASGTLVESIRPQKIAGGHKVIVESPASKYAAQMERGFNKPHFVSRNKPTYGGYTFGDWMDFRGLPSNLKGVWVGRGNGIPKRGYRYMERAYNDTNKVTPEYLRKFLNEVVK